MEENQVTQDVQTTPESVADDWDDEPLMPDESASDEPEKSLEELFGVANADADAKSGDIEENADAADASGNPASGKDAKPPDAKSGDIEEKSEPPAPDYKALYEGLQDQRNADKFRAVYHEQLALTGSESVARMVAMNECGGKAYPLEDAPEASGTSGAAPGKSNADFRAALSEIQSLYPDAVEMPQKVMESYMGGTPLKEAYASYRAAEDAKTIASLRAENAALKKSASNRAAAPVKGVNGDAPEKVDAFMAAFDEEF